MSNETEEDGREYSYGYECPSCDAVGGHIRTRTRFGPPNDGKNLGRYCRECNRRFLTTDAEFITKFDTEKEKEEEKGFLLEYTTWKEKQEAGQSHEPETGRAFVIAESLTEAINDVLYDIRGVKSGRELARIELVSVENKNDSDNPSEKWEEAEVDWSNGKPSIEKEHSLPTAGWMYISRSKYGDTYESITKQELSGDREKPEVMPDVYDEEYELVLLEDARKQRQQLVQQAVEEARRDERTRIKLEIQDKLNKLENMKPHESVSTKSVLEELRNEVETREFENTASSWKQGTEEVDQE